MDNVKRTKKEKKMQRDANRIRTICQYLQTGQSITSIATKMGLSSGIIMDYITKYHIDAYGYNLPDNEDLPSRGLTVMIQDVKLPTQTLSPVVAPELPETARPVMESIGHMRTVLNLGEKKDTVGDSNEKNTVPVDREKKVFRDAEPVSVQDVCPVASDSDIASKAEIPEEITIPETSENLETLECNTDNKDIGNPDISASDVVEERRVDEEPERVEDCSSASPCDDLFLVKSEPAFTVEHKTSDCMRDKPSISNTILPKSSTLVCEDTKEESKKQHFYLVDTENQGCTALKDLLSVPDPARKCLLFYTTYSQHMDFQTIRLMTEQAQSMEFFQCRYGIKDALDFQLISYLGYLIHQYPDAEFTIVTNDGGFDPAIEFWRDRHIRVSKVSAEICHAVDRSPNYRSNTASNYGSQRVNSWQAQTANRSYSNCCKKPTKPAATTAPVKNYSVTPVVMDSSMTFETEPAPMVSVKPKTLAQSIMKESITAAKQSGHVNLRKVDSCHTKYTPKQFRRVCQIASSELGSLFKKHGIKSSKTANIAAYMICYPDYSLSELAQLSDLQTATAIVDKISQAEINGMRLRAGRK